MADDISRVLQQLTGEIATLRREVARLKLLEVPDITIWTDWTPTVTQDVSVTFTATFARYTVIQNKVTLQIRLAITSAGTAANDIIISNLPFGVANVGLFSGVGEGLVLDSGTALYRTIVSANGANDLRMVSTSITNIAHIGTNPNFALASGDVISFTATYERT